MMAMCIAIDSVVLLPIVYWLGNCEKGGNGSRSWENRNSFELNRVAWLVRIESGRQLES